MPTFSFIKNTNKSLSRTTHISKPKTSMKGVYGRSMIEMLGVLAIISVLSAGGIMGYNQAMDAYTFNKFVKDTQTMAAATLSVFPKPHTRTTRIKWEEEALNRLGILPNELYKTAPSPTSEYVKNPFTGKIDWRIRLAEEASHSIGVWKSNLGTWNSTGGKPYTLLYFIIPVSKKVCVKMLTYNWSNLTPSWTGLRNTTYDPYYFIVSPISVAKAKTICKYDSNNMTFHLTLHNQETPVWR